MKRLVVKKGKSKLFVAFKSLKTTRHQWLIFENVAAMYEKTMYSIKLKKGHLGALQSNLGLKQGCPLSPILFNLYIDDIDVVFRDNCDPVELQGIKLSHFLYADDLVIISRTEEGLQKVVLDRVLMTLCWHASLPHFLLLLT